MGDHARHVETLAVHAGRRHDDPTGAVMPPIHLSTTFERGTDGSYPTQYVYTRSENPNRIALEECLAALEGGEAAAAFASGMAAIAAILQALHPGDHVLMPDDLYHGTRRYISEVLGPWGLDCDFIDMTDPGYVATRMRPSTRLIWVETPSNPLLKITDIAAVAEVAHRRSAMVAVDNTWASPICQQPLALGVDLVMHATTKYLGGHSDILGGAVISRHNDEFFQRLATIQKIGGSVPAPFDCWLLLRSIRTLPYRMRAHTENAGAVAQFLAEHPAVAAVHYPGLPQHPGHAVAARQMRLFGGMLSIQVRGGKDEAMAAAAKVKIFTRATSLGGVESLIEHRASIEGPHGNTPPNLLRISVGLEHPDDLIADLAQALG